MPEAEFLVWLKTTLLAAPGVSGLFGDRVLTPDDVGARGLAYDDLTAEAGLENRFVDSATGELKLLAYVSPETGNLMGRWWYKYRFRVFYYVSARNSDRFQPAHAGAVSLPAGAALSQHPTAAGFAQ